MNFCPQCGAKVENPESKFCAVCGEAFPTAAPSPAEEPSLSSLPQRPKPAPAPAADFSGITGSFSSPFVKDAVPAPAAKEEPLFSPVFSEDSHSLFENPAPAPVQQSPLPPLASAGGTGPRLQPSSASLDDFMAPAPKAEMPVAPPLSPSFAAPLGGQSAPAADEEAPSLVPPQGFVASMAATPEAPPSFDSLFPGPAQPAAETPVSLFGAGPGAENPAPPTKVSDLSSMLHDIPPLDSAEPSLFADAQPLGEDTAPALFQDPFAAQPAEAGLFADAQHLEESEAFAKPAAAQPHQPPKTQAAAPHKVETQRHVEPQREAPKPKAPRQEMPQPVQTPQQTFPGGKPLAEVGAAPLQEDLFSQQEAPVQRMPAPASILAESSSAARSSAPARRRPPPPPARSSRNSGRLVRNILIGVLVGLVLLFGAILGFLYWQNRPSQTIDVFIEALATRDYETLANARNVSIVNVTNSSSEGWIALCDAFQDEATRTALAKEMSRVSADPASSNFAYPSIRLVGDPYFLFIKTYRVHVTGVDVLVPGAAEGITLRLAAGDEFNDPAGELDPAGMLYRGIMPGQYSATVTLPDGNSTSYTLSAFAISQPNAVEGEAPAGGGETAPTFANLTISNCIADDAQIFLNGQETPAKPTDGVVELQQVELGTTISIKAVVDGATQEASVQFNDPNTTTLAFGEYTKTEGPAPDAGGELTAEQASATLTSFYKSYLEAINAQSLAGIQFSTEANSQKLQARISSPANKANTYTFVSAEIDPATLTTKEENGVLVAEFSATCTFSFVPKEGEAAPETGSNKQAVRMIQQDGQWLVDSFTTA